jgi:hypothetical protein
VALKLKSENASTARQEWNGPALKANPNNDRNSPIKMYNRCPATFSKLRSGVNSKSNKQQKMNKELTIDPQ